MSDLLDYPDALHALLETHLPLARTEEVPLAGLNQRVLAQDLRVRHDVPAFDNSAMDGYAIHGDTCGEWRVVHRIAAGDAGGQLALQAGQAARIFTGAPVPQGTTAVLMQEHVERVEGQGLIRAAAGAPIAAGQHIRRRAEELKAGEALLDRGQRFTPATIGLLSGQGYTHAPCLAPVRVTVFSTGNELVPPGQPLKAGQIYESNRIMLVTWLRALGFATIDGGNLPDDLATTREALQRAARGSDAIVCSGGVSVGEEDHLRNALAAVGELTHWRLRIKPGKPFSWGRIGGPEGDCRVFMLPGNPMASLVTFQLLALPALHRLAGLPPAQARPLRLWAEAGFSRDKADPRREFLRAVLEREGRGWRILPVARQGSNMLSGAARAQALVELAPGATVQPGDALPFYPLFNELPGL